VKGFPRLAAVTLLVGCDHASKQLAKGALEGGPPAPLVRGILDLQYRKNRDVAFELLRWIPERARAVLVLVLGALALAALTTALVRRRSLDATTAALLLLLAGAAGNYFDRLGRGYVVDFIHLSHWAVFNPADAYLVAGAVLIVAVRSFDRDGARSRSGSSA